MRGKSPGEWALKLGKWALNEENFCIDTAGLEKLRKLIEIQGSRRGNGL